MELVEFQSEYSSDFAQLNYDWIKKHFTVEDSDRAMLDNPQSYIIDSGGFIVMAIENNVCIGCGALVKHSDDLYELAKMAVSPEFQGKGIGKKITQYLVKHARKMGAIEVFLESNTGLASALNVYRAIGFVEVPKQPSPYQRCDIRMVYKLPSAPSY